MVTLTLLVTGCSNNDDRIVIYTSMEEERNQVSLLTKEIIACIIWLT